MQTEKRVLDIAIECGYEHEQTYIRAFKREYGITPGECRQSGKNIHLSLDGFVEGRNGEMDIGWVSYDADLERHCHLGGVGLIR